MVRANVLKRGCSSACCFFLAASLGFRPQDSVSSPLDDSGQISVDGRSTPYLIRHLPVDAFPQLPPAVQDLLNRRGCLIPQTYEAHPPENVVHASLERRGSSDWAVLCSVNGTVSLLVFFSSNPSQPTVLASAPETERLQAHGASNRLGFNWGIDPASPEQIHEAQLGMRESPAAPRPRRPRRLHHRPHDRLPPSTPKASGRSSTPRTRIAPPESAPGSN